MAKTGMFRELMRLARVAEVADRQGMPTREALGLAREKRLWTPTRRGLIQGAAAAAATAAVARPRTARATDPVVAVVGAGLAGLSCLETLAKGGVTATAYEATTRAGGRIWSMGGDFSGPVTFPGQVVERGGELIDTTHKMMRHWATEFGFDLEPSEDGYDGLYYLDGTVYDESDVVDEYRDLVTAMRIDLKKVGTPVAGATTADEEALDATSLADYLSSRGAGSLIAAMIEAAYVGEYGIEIDEQTCLAWLLFVHADRRSKWKPFGVFSDERFHIKSGNQSIPAALADRYADQIAYGHTLVAVSETSGGQIVLTFEKGASVVEKTVDHAVITLPFSVLRDVDFSGASLPSWKSDVIENTRYGTNSKHMIGFTGRPWRTVGGSGAMYASGLDTVQVVWQTNVSAASDTRAVLTNYSGGTYGASVTEAGVQAETAKVLADLDEIVSVSGSARKDSAGQYVAHIEAWPQSPVAKGSYTANALGYFTDLCDLEGVAVGNLHFAGEHTSSFYEWQGFMEGAALSGDRAASEVLAALKSKK